MHRNAVIVEPNAEQLHRYNAMCLGWTAALHAFEPGALSGDVEKIVAQSILHARNRDSKGCSEDLVGLDRTDQPHPGGGLHSFHSVNQLVLSCDLPWLGPGIGNSTSRISSTWPMAPSRCSTIPTGA